MSRRNYDKNGGPLSGAGMKAQILRKVSGVSCGNQTTAPKQQGIVLGVE